ncbi:MAG TPA: hypothetical protein VM842_04855 [Nitrospira sp.]|jgi:hypothetical protein|nr:hypothetical protein [Nitrospira sp.]
MNPRIVLIFGAVVFTGLLLVMGARAFARWVKTHYPAQASIILSGIWVLGIAGGWLIVWELREAPVYQPNDLLTLQEPVVARTTSTNRDVRSIACVIDLHEHLGLLEIEQESGTLTARVESNNTSAPLYCPIGTEIRVDMAWLHRPTVTRRGGASGRP